MMRTCGDACLKMAASWLTGTLLKNDALIYQRMRKGNDAHIQGHHGGGLTHTHIEKARSYQSAHAHVRGRLQMAAASLTGMFIE
jgi:hypothetical protein